MILPNQCDIGICGKRLKSFFCDAPPRLFTPAARRGKLTKFMVKGVQQKSTFGKKTSLNFARFPLA